MKTLPLHTLLIPKIDNSPMLVVVGRGFVGGLPPPQKK